MRRTHAFGAGDLIDFTNLPGAEDRISLILDEGPPAPLNLEPFGPNPWAGGRQSTVNIPAVGPRSDMTRGADTTTILSALVLVAFLIL